VSFPLAPAKYCSTPTTSSSRARRSTALSQNQKGGFMRTFGCIILSFFVFINASIASAQQNEDKKAISAFEKRVELFEKFFAARPKFLEKQSYSSSPSGYIYFWCRYDNSQISYDIQKTNSLVSPYMGYITVKYDNTVSKKCGDLGEYFSTIDIARKNRDNDSCYYKEISCENKFVFALQKGMWVFKDILNTYNNETDRRLAILTGQAGAGRFPVEDNDFWRVLIQN
jgi:hypothetical protein